MWALVPIKNMVGAKQRLAAILSPQERHDLFRAMLTDVLGALSNTASLDGVALITRDGEARDLAADYGADVFFEEANNGQTAAVADGVLRLMAEGVDAVMQIPGDVPLVTSAEIEQVIAAHLPSPSMTIVPARDEQGSNCVICSPPNCVALRFGENSFFPHLEAAGRAGISPTIVPLPGLGLDIDTPADLEALLAERAGTLSYRYLTANGIAARLQLERKSA